MHFEEFGHVEFWLLEDFDLSDVDLVKWVGGGGGLGDIGSDRVGEEFADYGADVGGGDLRKKHYLLYFI